VREVVKPVIEMLSGIPSVVIGFFALLIMATVLQNVFGYETRLNAFVAGIALSFSVIPLVFSISEDALTSVPRSYTQAALALGRIALADGVADRDAGGVAGRVRGGGAGIWARHWRNDDRADGLFGERDVVEHL
jgi:ABC-type uncharacterized transport system permease subunit